MVTGERNVSSTESRIRAQLQRQHGLITTAQWRDARRSASALSRALACHEFERVLPHVFRSTLIPPTFAQRALAAVLWAGPDALASHVTALRFYGTTEHVPDELHDDRRSIVNASCESISP